MFQNNKNLKMIDIILDKNGIKNFDDFIEILKDKEIIICGDLKCCSL